jgi:hypothetical protein
MSAEFSAKNKKQVKKYPKLANVQPIGKTSKK